MFSSSRFMARSEMTTLFYLNFLLNFSTILQYWEQPANFAKLFRITYQRGLEFPHAVHFSLHSKFKESWICTEHWASLSWSVTKIERWEMWHAVLSVWGLNGCLTGKLFSLIRWKSISEQDKFWSTKVLNWITLSLSHSKLVYTKWFYSRKCSFQNISPSASEADMEIRSPSIQLHFSLRKLCRKLSLILRTCWHSNNCVSEMILTDLAQLSDPEGGGLSRCRQDRIWHRGHGWGWQTDPRTPGQACSNN